MYYPMSVNQIIDDAYDKALKICNELGDKNKRYRRRVEKRNKLNRGNKK